MKLSEANVNRESGRFTGATREILLSCRETAEYGGADILIAVQIYLQYGDRISGGSSVERFFTHTLPEIRERELRKAYGR